MQVASFVGKRKFPYNIGDWLTRFRLNGNTSHTELVFQPSDGPEVAALMPDSSLEPDSNGALWCYSSVGLERLPDWSPRRAGRLGGARFTRKVIDSNWEIDDAPGNALEVAKMALCRQGTLYDWQFILGFVVWFVPHKKSRTACSEEIATVLGIPEPERFDPCSLRALLRFLSANLRKQDAAP